MFLMETKNDNEFVKRKLQDLRYPNYFSVPPLGLSGGLSLLWKDGVDINILESSPNLIDTRVTYKGVSTFISFIYGASALENRAAFWTKLSAVGAARDAPWFFSGDFNDMLNNSEKVAALHGGKDPSLPSVLLSPNMDSGTSDTLAISCLGGEHDTSTL